MKTSRFPRQNIDQLQNVMKCLTGKGHPGNDSNEGDILCRVRIYMQKIEVFGQVADKLYDIVHKHNNSYLGCKINLNAENEELLKEMEKQKRTFDDERHNLQTIEKHFKFDDRQMKKFNYNYYMTIVQSLHNLELRLKDMFNKINQVHR